jgi:hypothetical protein
MMFFFFALLHLEGAWDEIVLNPKGWNLPDTKRMTFVKVETLDIAGIPFEIRVEKWRGKSETTYRIRNRHYGTLQALAANRLVWENPLDLFIYRTPDEKILCYFYAREITDKAGFTYGAVETYICDLDDDGMNEFQMETDLDPNKLLTSFARIKLGLSEETSLIKRTISSALRALKNQ